MFTVHFSDRNIAKLVLYYAKRGAEAHTESLIEAPKVVGVAAALLEDIKDKF